VANDLRNLGMGNIGNFHIGNAIKNVMDSHPSFNADKDELSKGFIKKTKPHLNKAMDHLNGFAEHISKVEMHYQGMLDSLQDDSIDLETKVRLQDAASQHVINLKSLHGKQKATLTKITELFLQLSKSQIREMKGVKRKERRQ
jgi:hypothetical protein